MSKEAQKLKAEIKDNRIESFSFQSQLLGSFSAKKLAIKVSQRRRSKSAKLKRNFLAAKIVLEIEPKSGADELQNSQSRVA
jgi:hypothetical protein